MDPIFQFPTEVFPHEEALGFSRYVVRENWITQGFEEPRTRIVVLRPVGDSDAVFKIMREDGMIVYHQFAFGTSPGDEQLPGIWMHTKEKSEYLDAGRALKEADPQEEIIYSPIVRKRYEFKKA